MAHAAGQNWTNFHENISLGGVAIGDCPAAAGTTGPAWMRESADQLKALAADAIAAHRPLGLLGAQWSLSPLIGQPGGMLRTGALAGVWQVDRADLATNSPLDPSCCIFVGGGATLAQLSTAAEAAGKSLSTCGSYLQQSVAGAMATSVNGSRLDREGFKYGGFQNMVRGIHFVTSGNRSVWVEPASKPVLDPALARTFADEVFRDDRLFDGSLVHLGGMGIVNAVVMELEPSRRFSVMRLRQKVSRGWLDALQAGDFHAVATMLGHDAPPAYYEVQINPFDIMGSAALHTLYFELADCAAVEGEQPSALHTYDGIASAGRYDQQEGIIEGELALPNPFTDLFSFYSAFFFKPTRNNAPQGSQTWGQIHAKPPAAIQRGLVYTSAFSVARTDLAQTIERACAAMIEQARQGALKQMLLTLRFVSAAAGAMAFTRFGDSVVVDMEGLAKLPVFGHLPHARAHGLATIAALEQEPYVPHCPHWGKLQPPSAAKIEREFGPTGDLNSRVSLWRSARNALVPAIAQASMTNQALVDWKL